MSTAARLCRAILASALLTTALAAPTRAQTLPSGFIAEPVGSAWNNPVGLAYLDAERLLVAERAGRIWYVVNDVKQNLVYDIAGETLTNGDRGLLGIAVAPDFDLTGWLYLLLVVDVQGNDRSPLGFSRLIRIRTELDAQGLHALPATREALLGDTWSTGIPSCHLSHTIGSLRFLSDGSLVLTCGDNAHYDLTDAGGADPDCFGPARTSPDQDLGAYRAQYDDTLCGKVLRLDPATGRGLPDNPYFTGDANDLRSRIWARGLRNPFRFTLLPGSGPREALLIADVGWNSWEEINLCLGGENFGWPCYEGIGGQPEYTDADSRGLCAAAAANHTAPLIAWNHNQGGAAGFRGNCATGLAVYTGENYPPIYRQRLFFCDYGRNWLRAAKFDDHLQLESVLAVGQEMGGPVDLVAQPGTGDLVYASIASGVFRLRYVGARIPPVAVASATPAFGAGALDVELSARDSSDPEGQPLTYLWDLGNGASSTEQTVHQQYAGELTYTARVTVTDTEGLTDSAEVRITPNDTPPTILELLAPLDGGTFVPDEPMRLLARATDAEDGTPAQVTWTADLVHDHHVHPNWATASGQSSLLTLDSHGPGDNHFVVHLKVTDARGLSDERTLEIYDPHSEPQAHLFELAETSVRAGQSIAPIGHVDYSYGRVAAKHPTLTWDWGDGTTDVFPDAGHQVDTRPVHVYRRPGTYKLRLIASLDDATNSASATLHVAPPRPALAIFAPLEEELWVTRAEQEEIVARLQTALATRTSEVRAFHLGQGDALAAWMDSLASDSISDVLVLLDFVPTALVEGGIPGSLLQRWVTQGNGLVWSGATPIQTLLGDDGTQAQAVLGADAFFGTTPYVMLGQGTQTQTALGRSVLPSLPSYRADRALRYDRLGASWRPARIFSEDADHDSDALELEHSSHGFYAQFLCASRRLPRAEVLTEYLLDRLDRGRFGGASSTSAPAPR